MKKSIFWLGLALLISTSSFAFVADSFDAPRTEHIVKRGDFTGAKKPEARSPSVKSSLMPDNERGNVLRIDFNVSESYGGTYVIFRPSHIPENFDAVSFWLRGTPSAFKVELKDSAIHNFVVEKRSGAEWREIVIPIQSFSNSSTINKKDIKEFVFVFEDHRTSPRLGTIYLDNLTFMQSKEINGESRPREIILPGPVLVNGDIPANRTVLVSETKNLKLTTRVPKKAEFKTLRFEASWDADHWFYLKEIPAGEHSEYEYSWNVSSFPSGNYWIRAVFLDGSGIRHEGPSSRINLRNSFDFNAFLDDVQRKTFDYFVNEVDPKTFLVKDRSTNGSHYSTGLTGFQITAYVIGVERGWMKKETALHRLNVLMDYFLNHFTRYHGVIPHWLDAGRNEVWEIETGDLVETSFVVSGALTAKEYFKGNHPLEIAFRNKADQFYERIEWQEFLKRDKKENEKGLLPWHWSLRKGASALQLEGYNETMIVYLLALGSPTHSIPASSWDAWAKSYQKGKYGPYELIACAPLFTHQYTHLWVDFRGKNDKYADYFKNSILATLVNREFSLKENNYQGEIWGLTASEGPNNYKAYGAPPHASNVPVINDGTIAPTAAGTSIMFTPELSIAALKEMKDQYGDQVYGKYGFKDAFNPNQKWFFSEYLGLDQGPLLIGIENYRTGLIWRLFMQNPHIQEGLRKAGFQSESSETVPAKNPIK